MCVVVDNNVELYEVNTNLQHKFLYHNIHILLLWGRVHQTVANVSRIM